MDVKFTERGVRLEWEGGPQKGMRIYVYPDVVFVQQPGQEFPKFFAAREPEPVEVKV